MAQPGNDPNEVPLQDLAGVRVATGVVPPGSITNWDALLKQVGLTDEYKDAQGEYNFDKLAQDMAQLGKPKAPDEYDFSLPKGIQDMLPKGLGDWKPDPQFTAGIAAIARQNGVDQNTMSQFVGEYAKHQASKIQAGNAARDNATQARTAEMAKLGPNGQQRVDAVKSGLSGMYGNDHGIDAVNSKGIEVLEDLISKANAGGRAAPARGSGEAKPKASDAVKPGSGTALLRQANAKAA